MWARLRSEARHWWRTVIHRRQAEDDLERELSFHLEAEQRKLESQGMAPSEARRLAQLSFGGVERIKEEAREVRVGARTEQVWSDVRYVLRSLRARPTFTIGVVATLALGLGANTAMFGIVDRLMFRRPNALVSPERVYRVHLHWKEDGDRQSDRSMAFPRSVDLARESRSIDGIGAFQVRTVALGLGEDTHEGRVAVMSAGFLQFFQARPVLGRWFVPEEDQPPAGAAVVVLSHDYWMSRYGGRADVIGTPLRVDRLDAIVIGVAPPGFSGIADQGAPSVFVPLSAFAYSMRRERYVNSYNWGWLQLVVRLRDDVTVAQASSDLTNAYVTSWRREETAEGRTSTTDKAQPTVTLGPVQLGRGPDAPLDARVSLWLTGVALAVLLIACANIANLLLSRSISRQRELAMRLALGAGRGRLARQVLLEGIVLGLGGAFGGVLMARFGGATLRTLVLPDAAQAAVLTDSRTLWFTVLLAVVAGAVIAVAPALLSFRIEVATALRAGGRSATRRRSRLQHALVVVQAALSVLLLVGAALFVRSLQRAQERRLGYDVDRVVYAEVNMRGTAVGDSAVQVLSGALLDAARAVPGVTHATTATSVPFWSNESRNLIVEGVDSLSRLGRFTLQTGSSEYFQTIGTRILKGRSFTDEDGAGAPAVVVVSEGMAAAVWPGREAIGQCFRIEDRTGPCRTVIGIAEEGVLASFESSREYAYYLPVTQFPQGLAPQFFIRIAEGQALPLRTLRSQLQAQLSGAAYVNVIPMEDLVSPQLRGWRFGATMLSAFGVLALVLAALGLHSLISYDLAQREKELGVRLALGATRLRIVHLVVWQGTRLAATGLGIGLLLAFLLSGSLQPLMFEQSARDVVIFGAAGAMLLAVSVVACAIPGWRATVVDPVVTLRQD